MKKKIDVIALEESFHNLSTFNDIEELNKTVRAHRDAIRVSVKRADVQARLIALLEVLKRHSCKYVGVSFMCKNKLADKLEVSYKTVQRLMKKLEQIGIIRQVPMKRKSDMLQTANAVVIQPIAEEVTDKTPGKKSEKCPANKTNSSSLKTNTLNKRNMSTHIESTVDNIKQANFISHWVPDRFATFVSSFYQEAKTIQELWKVVRQCNSVVNFETGERAFTKDQELTIGVKAIKEFIMKVKAGVRMKKGIFAYFNGIVNNLMDKYFFDRNFMGEN